MLVILKIEMIQIVELQSSKDSNVLKLQLLLSARFGISVLELLLFGRHRQCNAFNRKYCYLLKIAMLFMGNNIISLMIAALHGF